MTESNRDVEMAPRERPMPHENPPTKRDSKSLAIYIAIGIVAVTMMILAGFAVSAMGGDRSDEVSPDQRIGVVTPASGTGGR